ncbi:MAG: hypothetical protein FWE57_01095 [Chitinispirillia bacterium]|nr:hypothetical protein [Chitinispirillia bacterium]
MSAKRLSALVLILAGLFVQTAFSQSILTVGQTDPDAMYRSVQAAVNAARPNDIIEILDVGVYHEQVTIDSTKGGLTIRSRSPLSRQKPTIRWQDTENNRPRNSTEARDPQHSGNFETCGALRILRAPNVTIDGIVVDGGGSAPFAWPSVWDGRWPLFHGNAAIAVVVAQNAVIRNCDLRNAWFGIAVKDRNTGGVFANRNPGDQDNTVPLSRFAQSGNHLFEYNRIHNNSVGIYFESSWDLGSTIRYNLIFNNHHGSQTPTPPGTNRPMPNVEGTTDDAAAGAISFKDNYLSPVAIYNNTLFNNTTNIIGGWQIGFQHLLFNNIFSSSNRAIGQQSVSGYIGYRDVIPGFPNRIHNSVMSAYNDVQTQPQQFQPISWSPLTPPEGCIPTHQTFIQGLQILNQVGNPAATPTQFSSTNGCTATWNAVAPGAFIPNMGGVTIPSDRNFRWLQMEGVTRPGVSLPSLFMSTDPAHDDFLRPNWSLPEVQNFIRNRGWAAVGMYNADGQVADLGAITSIGTRQNTVVRVVPTDVVMVNSTTAEARFAINVESGTFNNPTVKFIRWVSPIDSRPDVTGFNGDKIVPATAISGTGTARPITVPPGTALNTRGGTNTITFTLPTAVPATGTNYGFFEIVIEGRDAANNPVTSDIGFLPFRTLTHRLRIEVFPPAGPMISRTDVNPGTALDSVTAGEPVRLRITPLEVRAGVPIPIEWSGTLNRLTLSLLSDVVEAKMFTVGSTPPAGELTTVTNLTPPNSPHVFHVYFVRKAEETISGAATAGAGASEIVFRGSQSIRVKAGPPARVSFVDPRSRDLGISIIDGRPDTVAAPITPGSMHLVTAKVQDLYGNTIDDNPNIALSLVIEDAIQSAKNRNGCMVADVITPLRNVTPPDSLVRFNVQVSCGIQNEWFDMKATITSSPNNAGVGAFDIGRLRVGRSQERLYIFFSDDDPANDADVTVYHDPGVGIEAIVRDRERVAIKAVDGGGAVMTGFTGPVCVGTSRPEAIEFYASATSAERLGTNQAVVNLVGGKGEVWITSAVGVIDMCITASNGTCESPNAAINPAQRRCDVNFEERSNDIESAIVLAEDNGNGIPTRMLINFVPDGSFEPGGGWNLPPSVTLMWPEIVDPAGNNVTLTAAVTVENTAANPTAITATGPHQLQVVFPGTHAPGYTTVEGRNTLGSLVWDGEVVAFSVVDSIGPIISAEGEKFGTDPDGRTGPMLMENPGRTRSDTIMIQISEPLLVPHALMGASILHRKPRAGETAPRSDVNDAADGTPNILTVTSLSQAVGEWFYLGLSNFGGIEIDTGDYIRFNPVSEHDIRDVRSNAVNPLNRWVRLIDKPVPPVITDESFYTNDPAPVVDLINNIAVRFNKPVNLAWFDDISVTISGTTATGKAAAMVHSGAIIDTGAANGIIHIDPTKAFPEFAPDSDNIRNITSGAIGITFSFHNSGVSQGWASITSSIRDQAKPVLVSARFQTVEGREVPAANYVGAVLKPGAPNDDGTFARDTLIVTYTEMLDDAHRHITQPLKFWRTEGGVTSVGTPVLEVIGQNPQISGTRNNLWHQVTYIVHGTNDRGAFFDDDTFLKFSDSVSINTTAGTYIKDVPGNEQTVLENKKIAIRIENKVSWGLRISNNPFTAKDARRDQMTVRFTPNVRGATDLVANVTVLLYDHMGNLVRKDEAQRVGDELEWTWRGHNRRGRLVGSGTYHLKAVMEMHSRNLGMSDRTTEVRAVGFVR